MIHVRIHASDQLFELSQVGSILSGCTQLPSFQLPATSHWFPTPEASLPKPVTRDDRNTEDSLQMLGYYFRGQQVSENTVEEQHRTSSAWTSGRY
jgi:hypothetical protein